MRWKCFFRLGVIYLVQSTEAPPALISKIKNAPKSRLDSGAIFAFLVFLQLGIGRTKTLYHNYSPKIRPVRSFSPNSALSMKFSSNICSVFRIDVQKQLYYNANHIGYGKERDLQMKQLNDITCATETKKKIFKMLEKIDNENLLNRIYRFVKYIYIHKT